jgi:hypothetical protein
MGRGDVQAKLLDEPGQPRGLAFREFEDEARQRGGVDDRVLERTLQAASDKPRVECVVAVLDQHGALRETQKPAPGVFELRRADQHRAVDVVTPFCVRVDRRAAVDKRVEEGQRAVEREALGADLEDEKRCVARSLHVQRDELRVVE